MIGAFAINPNQVFGLIESETPQRRRTTPVQPESRELAHTHPKQIIGSFMTWLTDRRGFLQTLQRGASLLGLSPQQLLSMPRTSLPPCTNVYHVVRLLFADSAAKQKLQAIEFSDLPEKQKLAKYLEFSRKPSTKLNRLVKILNGDRTNITDPDFQELMMLMLMLRQGRQADGSFSNKMNSCQKEVLRFLELNKHGIEPEQILDQLRATMPHCPWAERIRAAQRSQDSARPNQYKAVLGGRPAEIDLCDLMHLNQEPNHAERGD